MKKIINGRKYDTDTAREIFSWENTWDIHDFHRVCETLYCKRNGEYFLHGEGGGLTQYAEMISQNSWRGGEALIPLDYDTARKWAEEHMDADSYEKEFGEVSEDGEGEIIAVTVRIGKDTKSKLDRLAAKSSKTRGEIVAEALAAYAI